VTLTLARLNTASTTQALAWLEGLYEHSPWIVAQALSQRPFKTLAQFKLAMVGVVREASREQQFALVLAHPEFAGNAGISHNPLETITNDDADLGVQAFQELLETLAADMNKPDNL